VIYYWEGSATRKPNADFARCPYTHRKFSTGVETSAKSLRGSWKAKIEVNCPHCHKTHKISVRKAYVDNVLSAAAVRPRQNI
jgi:hypothetical protein